MTEWLRYDALGNICQKASGGTAANNYTYAQLGGCGQGSVPGSVAAGSANSGYQLLQVGSAYYTTDANGSLTRATTAANGGGTVQRGWDYDGQNHAVAVWTGGSSTAAVVRTRWDYGADGARFRRTDDGTGQAAGTTLYLDNVERVTVGGSVTWRRTVAGTVMTLAGTTAGLVNSTRTLLGDQIGSVDAVADLASGGLVERADYAAFGAMRTALSAVVVGVAPLTTTTRGFTGQEQLGALDLVHLNGRIYDPLLGRFLQADPLVAQPYNPQNWNPYSYVFNNPLANTDPTGMFSIGQLFRTVLSIAISIWLPGAGFIFGGLANTLFANVVAGFVAGAIGSGSLKGGLTGAFSAGLFYGIGTQFKDLAEAEKETSLTAGEEAAKVLEHGIAGGVMSVLQGGKFGNGFISAGVTEAFSGPISHLDAGNLGVSAERVVAASIVGGTASQLTGGKFADGAITGAFSQAFNDEKHKQNVDGDPIRKLTASQAGAVMDAAREDLWRISKMSDDAFLREFPDSNINSGMDALAKSDQIWTDKQEIITPLGLLSLRAGVRWGALSVEQEYEFEFVGVAADGIGERVSMGWDLYRNYSSFTEFLGHLPFFSPNVDLACKVGAGCVFHVD
ncbi:MAG: RHS repeat-associated core domain-containing protein [Proteobacteria bacterium]|nr:RHS repeat-associated core domain-containing protein [Pseudomonadota bacterium]